METNAQGRALPRRFVAGSRAAIVLIAPAVFFGAMLYHPFLADLSDPAVVAEAAGADPTRWLVAHLLVGIGFGLLALAFLALRGHLRDAGEDRWSAVGLPFVVLASALFVFLPALELAPVAALRAGSDPLAMQVVLEAWFGPIMAVASLLFAIGAVAFAVSVVRSGAFAPTTAWVVAAALVVMALARFPSSVSLLVWGGASVLAFWPLARAMWASRDAAEEPSSRRSGRPMA